MTNEVRSVIIDRQNKQTASAALTRRISFHRVDSQNKTRTGIFCGILRVVLLRAADVFCVRFFCIYFRRGLFIATKELQINEEIRDKEVRVITDDGEQLGIMSAKQALDAAVYRNLDLVKIAPQAQPPVCKIMDYGKYRFEQQKREKEARKNQKIIEIKEVQLSLNIDTHDFETKANHARRFLQAGNKVKVSIRFRGREMAHPERGIEIMNRFAEMCEELCTVEKQPKLEGRNMLMFLAAKPTKK